MDSYIKFIASNGFQKKLAQRKGLSRNQLLAYRDFQNNFQSRITAYEEQFQAPIEEKLTIREVINLNQAKFQQDEFSVKEFQEQTGLNKNTARRELQSGVRRGTMERVKKGVYRYK